MIHGHTPFRTSGITGSGGESFHRPTAGVWSARLQRTLFLPRTVCPCAKSDGRSGLSFRNGIAGCEEDAVTVTAERPACPGEMMFRVTWERAFDAGLEVNTPTSAAVVYTACP